MAEILMFRTLNDYSFLIVEGTSDSRFWLPIKHDTCEMVDSEGKQNVLGCIRRLDAQKFHGALGVIDSDYDQLDGIRLESTNLVSTDAHDLESLLCRSSSLARVLAELGNARKIREFEAQAGHDVRTALLQRALIFGRLRWAAIKYELDIDTTQINIPRFVDEATWIVDQRNLLQVVARSDVQAQVLKRRMAEPSSADAWHIVLGSDLIEILRSGLRRVLGDLPASSGKKEILRILRAGMPLDELKSTGLGIGVRDWEARNSPYKIYCN